MRALGLTLLLLPLTLSASAPAQPGGEPLDSALQRARSEQSAAERQEAALENAASRTRGQAERLHAEWAAAAQAIEAAEARITASDIELRLASAYVAAQQMRLARQQQPASALLAGLAVMAQRPPLLALADRGSTDELVEVRILLDSTLPVIRDRTSRLSAEVAEGQRLQQVAVAARKRLAQNRNELVAKRQQFAALEQQALEAALATGGQALRAGDTALAAGENVETLRGAEATSRATQALAQKLAAGEPAPPRPFPAEGAPSRPPFAYALPATAPVTEGLAAVNAAGVRSRGLTLATPRGAAVTAPAEGIVRFAGPFRDYDGILIIDHGGGWTSLIVNLASPLRPGAKVRLGDPLGRALGPLQVELSRNGRRISPAIIAGSSQALSKGSKGG
ncbi:MAG TPA: peptidoglycan DD-metalloendopeptidase family protein [Stellaceae bacterium]|nr:peptidoglycan DD-metalloendopeptidase family protein [Stellaceae bacterium]